MKSEKLKSLKKQNEKVPEGIEEDKPKSREKLSEKRNGEGREWEMRKRDDRNEAVERALIGEELKSPWKLC